MGKQSINEQLKKLNRETEMIFDSVKDLSEEDLHDPLYGWTIIQVLSHLNMAEFGSLRYMKKKMQAGDQMPTYSTINRMRYILTKGVLQSSLRWSAPMVVANPKGDYSLEGIKDEWTKTREAIKNYVEEYPDKLLSKAVYKHPFAGRLDLESAIGSFIYHQRHHIHQIKRIRKKMGK